MIAGQDRVPGLIHDFHLSAKNASSQIKTKNILQSKAYEIYQKHALQFTA